MENLTHSYFVKNVLLGENSNYKATSAVIFRLSKINPTTCSHYVGHRV